MCSRTRECPVLFPSAPRDEPSSEPTIGKTSSGDVGATRDLRSNHDRTFQEEDDQATRLVESLSPLAGVELIQRFKQGTDPIVSVVIPCFNEKRFAAEAIRSVSVQSFEQWERIIVDDGSTDGSLAEIWDAAKDDTRIRVLRHQKNSGLGASWKPPATLGALGAVLALTKQMFLIAGVLIGGTLMIWATFRRKNLIFPTLIVGATTVVALLSWMAYNIAGTQRVDTILGTEGVGTTFHPFIRRSILMGEIDSRYARRSSRTTGRKPE